MKTIENLKTYGLIAILFLGITLTSCNNDDDEIPDAENHEEIITNVKLIFTPTTGAVVEARAQDPDGEGLEELEILDEITLAADTDYTLTFEIMNNLEEPGEDIGKEINEEADEHQIFFGFTTDAFSTPTGTGNISGSSTINYLDFDENQNPLGLQTSWSTGPGTQAGEFTVRLQHQPDIKDDTTGATDGDTDFELTFVLNIQ